MARKGEEEGAAIMKEGRGRKNWEEKKGKELGGNYKSVMEAIPIYPMMTTIIPRACVDEIQRMQQRFIWGDTDEKDGIMLLGGIH